MPGSRRIHRVNDLIQEVANEVMRQVKDPAVEGALITITSVNVSPDMSSARLYVTVMGKPVAEVVKTLTGVDEKGQQEVGAALKNICAFRIEMDTRS